MHIEAFACKAFRPLLFNPNGGISGMWQEKHPTTTAVICTLLGVAGQLHWLKLTLCGLGCRRDQKAKALGEVPCCPWARSPGASVPSQARASGPRCNLAFGRSVIFSCPNSRLSFKNKTKFKSLVVPGPLNCQPEAEGVAGMRLHIFCLMSKGFVRPSLWHPGRPKSVRPRNTRWAMSRSVKWKNKWVFYNCRCFAARLHFVPENTGYWFSPLYIQIHL